MFGYHMPMFEASTYWFSFISKELSLKWAVIAILRIILPTMPQNLCMNMDISGSIIRVMYPLLNTSLIIFNRIRFKKN